MKHEELLAFLKSTKPNVPILLYPETPSNSSGVLEITKAELVITPLEGMQNRLFYRKYRD